MADSIRNNGVTDQEMKKYLTTEKPLIDNLHQ